MVLDMFGWFEHRNCLHFMFENCVWTALKSKFPQNNWLNADFHNEIIIHLEQAFAALYTLADLLDIMAKYCIKKHEPMHTCKLEKTECQN